MKMFVMLLLAVVGAIVACNILINLLILAIGTNSNFHKGISQQGSLINALVYVPAIYFAVRFVLKRYKKNQQTDSAKSQNEPLNPNAQ